jgi:hypothetical protein
MANKDFILFQYRDWKQNCERLCRELDTTGGVRAVKLLEIEKASRYVKQYKKQLHDEFGIDA